MNLVELLADHADALNASPDVVQFDSEEWLFRYAPDMVTNPGVLPLLRLGHRVKQVLLPIPAQLPFRVALHQQLLHTHLTEEKRPFLPFGWRGAAVLGSLLSLTGLFILLVRRWRGGEVTETAV